MNDLFVETEWAKSHTIVFNGTYNRLNLDATKGFGDGKDNVTFNGNASNSIVKTGNGYSSGGDNIRFNQNVTNTQITTSRKNDSVIFQTSNTDGSTINLGNGPDSISFLSANKVAAGTTINLGGTTPGTGDGATDIIFAASKSTFVGSNIKINNFVDNVDEIRVGTDIIKTKADANTYFEGGISFG